MEDQHIMADGARVALRTVKTVSLKSPHLNVVICLECGHSFPALFPLQYLQVMKWMAGTRI